MFMPAVGIYCAPVNEWACHVIVRTKRARGSLFALGQQTSSRLLPRLLLADRVTGFSMESAKFRHREKLLPH